MNISCSYLIRFLSTVAEYSHENKMTASNLGICIGCSLLFPKDQLSNSTMSSSYASASMIVELMIVHHKQLFPSSSSSNQSTTEQQSYKSFKSQPDLIPTEFHSVIYISLSFSQRIGIFFLLLKKSRSGSNENLLESPNINVYPPP